MEELMAILPSEDREDFKNFFQNNSMPGFDVKEIEGYRLYPGFAADGEVEYAYDEWNIRKNDVLISSFPKTGTNWVAEIVRLILYQDEKMAEVTRHLPFQFFLLEVGSKKKFDFFDKFQLERRYLSTHLPSELINLEKIKKAGAKVVYLLRNPKDQIVSWQKFAERMPHGQKEPWKSMLTSGWEEYFKHVTAGKFEMNTKPDEWYFEHILSWYKHRDNKTVYFMYFEDLKKDTMKEVKLLADFLEIPLTDEKAKEVVEKCSFGSMKDSAKSLANKTMQFIRQKNMRKGQVGEWKNYFSESQSQYIDELMKEKLKETDIEFTYEL